MATAANTIPVVRPALADCVRSAPSAELVPIGRDWRSVVRAARSPLELGVLADMPLRRFAANVCTAEVKHSHRDFWERAYAIGAGSMIDRHAEPDIDVAFRLSHEALASTALVWLSHLQSHDGDRFGTWATWPTLSPAQKQAWRAKRRTIRDGLAKAVADYRAARALLN